MIKLMPANPSEKLCYDIEIFGTERFMNFSRAWLIWVVGVSYYFYQYIIRISPSVMVVSFSHDFHLTAMSYGLMSSYYFYSYALMQAPVGIIVDKFGAKRPMVLACSLLAISCFVFDLMPNGALWDAELLRLLMGLGSAFAFVGVLRLCATWFPPEKFPFLCGITNAIGMAAGFVGSASLAWVSEHFGWRHMYLILGVVGILIASLLLLFIQDKKGKESHGGASLTLADFWTVFKSPKNWYLGLQGACYWYPVSGLGALWGTDYISKMYNVPETIAASVSGTLFAGALLGTILFGWLMSFKQFKHKLGLISSVLGVITSACVVWVKVPIEIMSMLLFLLGMYTAGQVCVYVLAKEEVKQSLSGAVMGLINSLVISLGAVSQPLIGMLINSHAGGRMLDGQLVYNLADFNYAMSSIPLVCGINLLMSVGYKLWRRRDLTAK